MPNYRRIWQDGGIYFFTVALRERGTNDLLIRHIDSLRLATQQVRSKYPFKIHSWVVLPDHTHCMIELPEGDADFALRIRLIKRQFSISLPRTERPMVRASRGELGIWQQRYWEHLIRDESDYYSHVKYIHFNPVKHGLVTRVADWPYSTFHKWSKRGMHYGNWEQETSAMTLDHD